MPDLSDAAEEAAAIALAVRAALGAHIVGAREFELVRAELERRFADVYSEVPLVRQRAAAWLIEESGKDAPSPADIVGIVVRDALAEADATAEWTRQHRCEVGRRLDDFLAVLTRVDAA